MSINNRNINEFIVNDNTKLENKKYKTISDLKKSSMKNIIVVTSKIKNKTIKIYLEDWIFENHYSKKTLQEFFINLYGL